MPSTFGRRRVVTTLASAAAATGFAGLASAHGGGRQRAPLHAQLRVVEAQTRPYAHPTKGVERAVDDGYDVMGPVVPGMGFHLVDFDRIDDRYSLREPEALTYRPDGTLGGVEYVGALPEDGGHGHDGEESTGNENTGTESTGNDDGSGHEQHAPDLFDDEDAAVEPGEADGWHAHHAAQHVFATPTDCVTDDPDLEQLLDPENWTELVFDQSRHADPWDDAVEGLAAGDELATSWGTPTAPEETRVVDDVLVHDAWNTLHAWVHVENPHGTFASENPAFVPVPDDGESGHSH